ncbi:RNA-binding domain-containing protein [Backusella circina FSU 941]|nr:RNA-binding domain-containing protein [Backusella circina FSU 941]
MSSALDMALDDVITQNRSSNRRNNNNNGRRGPARGGVNKNRSGRFSSSPYNGRSGRQSNNQNNNRSSSNNNSNSNNKARSSGGNNLVVANLHFNVTEKDLYDLFGQIGQLKRAFLHIGPNGKSAGIADIVFASSNDAERAKVTYNNVELDGRPMRITNASITQAVQSTNSSAPRRNTNNNNNNGGGNRRFGGRNNNNRRTNNQRSQPNERDLDADMDSYMANNEDTQMN